MYLLFLPQGLGPWQLQMQEHRMALQPELALILKVWQSVAGGHPGPTPLYSAPYLLQLKACIHTQHKAGSKS